MPDTTPVTIQLTRLISAGTTEQAILAAVAQLFPNLTTAELSAALQEATAKAERQAPGPSSSQRHVARCGRPMVGHGAPSPRYRAPRLRHQAHS